MKVITEIELRELYKKKPFDSYHLVYPEKLTPSACQFLNEKRIKVIDDKIPGKERASQGFIILDSKRTVMEKPEEFTHLKGSTLVLKNHKRIKFRGRVDSLEANFINTIVECRAKGHIDLADDLNKIFEYIKGIIRAEVLGEPLSFIDFNGWSAKDIREYSHYPEKHFGVKHFVPDPKYGKIMALVNILRTEVRELEVYAVDAFYNEKETTIDRLDIILALNRLSSLIYIIMCQILGGKYEIL